ncbi:DeoR family transcriptional regulator [Cupriavidus gilardii J11]|uniref:DeoR family transcriptional regulator n=1 Tax=Cupriavidus gilardii J11 TaxID=936133 RepID=A0A562B8R8_9BURK|nr:DeoR/GlpR family DNA-binding transcription regulator [Cupriavidus gilardii]TWG81300.1 DeoR family transcriptional regulator [Cupriavidus gilardii J11]
MSLSPRQREILGWLSDASRLSTDQLASRFGVSSQTIRRDINALSAQGLARRMHGGLSLPGSQHNLSYTQRSTAHVERKRRIARRAVAVVEPDTTLFLGYGTTVAEFARALPPELPLRVVTNNLDAAHALADKPEIETWVTGGRLRPRDRDLMGSVTLDFLRRFRAHLAICGAAAIDAEGGLYEFQPDEAELSRMMLSHSHSRVLLADSSKYLRDAPCRVATLDQIDHFFTDVDAATPLPALCERAGVALHLC